MFRIAIAGFQHETNTFAPNKTDYAAFEVADSWPQFLSGEEVITQTKGMNLPIAGFVEAAEKSQAIELVPIVWCAAEPAGHVTDEAFDAISEMILKGLRGAGELDGIYLDLHGAMVTESHFDGEGALLTRIRSEFGEIIPIVISLDLHANISRDLVELADKIAVYRTYPHLDMAATGARCADLLADQIGGRTKYCAFRQIPFLIALHAQYTGDGPAAGLYEMAINQLPEGVSNAELALGFTASDIPDCGPSIVVYGDNETSTDKFADRLLNAFLDREQNFYKPLLSPDAAVDDAMRSMSDRPVIIADVQDNPGAGATSDTTGLLSALVDVSAKNALLGLLCDPEMAAKAQRSGLGNIITGSLGGKSGSGDTKPFTGSFKVIALSDGQCVYTGEMYGGGIAVLGPCAILQVCDEKADVKVVVSSNRSQCLDQAIFTHIGMNPKDFGIVCVKSTVHYRADFEPIAEKIIECAAPGDFVCQLEKLDYQHLRSGMRVSCS